jgi:hypothetical protein
MSQSMFMFDDVNIGLEPPGAFAYAGYIDGIFANITELENRFPGAHFLDIAVFPSDNATCLDVEPGDAINADVFAWFNRQIARKVYRPVIYTSASNAFAMQSTMKANGFARSSYRLWTAHYTNRPHFCSPSICGFGIDQADATQFTSKAMGRSLDESLVADNFFAPRPGLKAVNPVAGLKATPRFTQCDLSWNRSSHAASYRVNVWLGSNVLTRKLVQRIDTVTTSLTLHGLTEKQEYNVTVLARPATTAAVLGKRARVFFTTK